MNDMSSVIVPKSDQINADDLIAGPMTITITSVAVRGGQEQPVSVSFEGSKKVFRPCKSMCRVMVNAWGPDANRYVGKSMTLYRDPSVKWGGMDVGGIRISHMTDIERDMVMALTEKKGSRKPFIVKPLVAQPSQEPASNTVTLDKVQAGVDAMLGEIADAEDVAALLAVVDRTLKQRQWLEKNRPDLHATVDAALRTRHDVLADAEVPQ
jgi:hypothetical protein